MAFSLDQLPDDIDTLKRLLIERDAEVERRRAQVEEQRAEVLLARLMIEKLQLEIARLRRIQFGRRSERHDTRVTQLELMVEELETTLAAMPAPPASAVSLAASASPPARPVRRAPPAHLPRENVVHAAPCSCPEC